MLWVVLSEVGGYGATTLSVRDDNSAVSSSTSYDANSALSKRAGLTWGRRPLTQAEIDAAEALRTARAGVTKVQQQTNRRITRIKNDGATKKTTAQTGVQEAKTGLNTVKSEAKKAYEKEQRLASQQRKAEREKKFRTMKADAQFRIDYGLAKTQSQFASYMKDPPKEFNKVIPGEENAARRAQFMNDVNTLWKSVYDSPSMKMLGKSYQDKLARKVIGIRLAEHRRAFQKGEQVEPLNPTAAVTESAPPPVVGEAV